ncbi:sensor histidine kinase [Hufsiella ginkgonis]|uniref:histidine kinase n=1 Tax=Hufsiella ginkgonis TaxID=2695274 RepID=A0A7K1XSE2_9SPHI|nr:7TM diverse intracellular signaling domain-containing protein [Hufsiella ginkgonis]MXV13787.1 hypothetical protein [Hufsiella ginkgonis]
MRIARTIFIALGCAIWALRCSAQPVIVADAKDKKLAIAKSVALFLDTTGRLSYKDVSSAAFQHQFAACRQDVPDFGIQTAPVWCRFSIKNACGEKLYLKLDNTELEWIDLYTSVNNSVLKASLSAYRHFSRRDLSINKNIFLLDIPKDSTRRFYLRVKTSTGLQFPIYLLTNESLISSAQQTGIFDGIYIGFMVLMILYNLFIYTSLRDRAYLFYVLYVVFITLTNLIEQGLAFQYLWPGAPQLNRYVNVIGCFAGSFAILFTAEFLQTRKNAKGIHRFFHVLIFGYCINIIFILCGYRFWGMIIAELVSMLGVVSLFITGIILYRRGYKPAKYYLFAWTILLIGVSVFLLKDYSIVPYNPLTVSALRIGSAIEALLLSFALANKINIYREEKEAAQAEAFNQLNANKKLVLEQNLALEGKVAERTRELNHSLQELKSTQTQLIQSEKMASLGEFTAGIAHEMQNPLNFVNNFSEVSVELLEELKQEAETGNTRDVLIIAHDLKQNLDKIHHHGQRAGSIVKSMLEHSRVSSGRKEPADLNKLTGEYLLLAYHGIRGKDKSFNADLVTHLEEDLPNVPVVAQDIGRVLLNLYNNAFYAIQQKQKTAGADYQPCVEVRTMHRAGRVNICVKDNGTGIPEAIRDKIMQPFFTTKPTGEGTGLGLSLSYDIVVKGHGGSMIVDTRENDFTEFVIEIPI